MPPADKQQGDAFDFADTDVEDQFRELGKKLLQPVKSKDALIKLLKQAGSVLEHGEQSSAPQRYASADLAKALVQKHILEHKDKDVKLCTAHCLAHILRIYAPESPFSTGALQDIFALFLQIFRRLAEPSAPSYQLCLAVLDTVSKVKCCLLMLDFDGDEAVCDLFKVLLDTISPDNRESVEASALELMGSIVEESDDVSQQLLDTILDPLLAPKKDENPAAHRLAQLLLRRTEEQLRPHLQRFLTNVIVGNATDSELREDYHNLIYQVYQACPQTLLPVLPHLTLELQVDVDAKRMAAITLLGRLFTLPGSDMDAEYSELFTEFMRRFVDQKVEVRLHMLGYAKALLTTCTLASTREQVLTAVRERLKDFDERVRSAAVAALCEAAASDLRCVSLDALQEAAFRLRDKKLTVRKEAASQLAGLFRAYCAKQHAGAVVSGEEEAVIWVPGTLLLRASQDPELAQHLSDNVLRTGLFPPKLPVEHVASQWGTVYMNCSEAERMALRKLVRARAALQADVSRLVDLRTAQPDEAGRADHEAKLQALLLRIAAAFADSSRAEDALKKLRELRDNNIFRNLGTLASPSTPLDESAKLAKDVVQRVGSRTALGDFTRSLCAKMAPSLLSSEHLRHICIQACEAASSDDEPFQAALLDLLVDMAAAAPQLFANLPNQVLSMLREGKPALSVAAAKVLARAGAHMRLSDRVSGLMVDLKPTLLKLCTSGPPTAAKAAVRALFNLLGPDAAHEEFVRLLAKLAGSLELKSTASDGCMQLHTKLATISAVGRAAPQLYAQYIAAVTQFVTEDLLRTTFKQRAGNRDPKAGQVWGHFSPGIVIKAAALKALARSLVPDMSAGPASQPTPEALQGLAALVPLLAAMVEPENELADYDVAGDKDEAALRLAAATALLRLARAHDSRLGAETYLQLALAIQDPVVEVRSVFAAKVKRTMAVLAAEPGRAAKMAAMLCLAGMDPTVPNRQAAWRHLHEFVTLRRHQASAMLQAGAGGQGGGTVLQNYPEFLLPFALQILAHHPDLPTRQEMEEEGWLQLKPFQNMLQFALEPLLLPASCPAGSPAMKDAASASLPIVCKILRNLKMTEDATAQPQTDNLHLLCDVALAIAQALAERAGVKGSEGHGFPGRVPLPAALYRHVETAAQQRPRDGSCLPHSFEVLLVDLVPPPNGTASAAPGAKQRKTTTKAKQKPDAAAAAKPGRKRSSPARQARGAAGKKARRAAQAASSSDEDSESSEDSEASADRAAAPEEPAEEQVSAEQDSGRHKKRRLSEASDHSGPPSSMRAATNDEASSSGSESEKDEDDQQPAAKRGRRQAAAASRPAGARRSALSMPASTAGDASKQSGAGQGKPKGGRGARERVPGNPPPAGRQSRRADPAGEAAASPGAEAEQAAAQVPAGKRGRLRPGSAEGRAAGRKAGKSPPSGQGGAASPDAGDPPQLPVPRPRGKQVDKIQEGGAARQQVDRIGTSAGRPAAAGDDGDEQRAGKSPAKSRQPAAARQRAGQPRTAKQTGGRQKRAHAAHDSDDSSDEHSSQPRQDSETEADDDDEPPPPAKRSRGKAAAGKAEAAQQAAGDARTSSRQRSATTGPQAGAQPAQRKQSAPPLAARTGKGKHREAGASAGRQPVTSPGVDGSSGSAEPDSNQENIHRGNGHQRKPASRSSKGTASAGGRQATKPVQGRQHRK